MSETKKLTQEELQQLMDLREGYAKTTTQFGQARVEKMMLQQQLENLEKFEFDLEQQYATLQKTETTIVESLNGKYGTGQLNLETGEFTPIDTDTNS